MICDRLTTVLTEDEVLLFNPDFSIRLIKGLPDLAEEIAIVESTLEIRLMSGGSWFLNTRTGAFFPKWHRITFLQMNGFGRRSHFVVGGGSAINSPCFIARILDKLSNLGILNNYVFHPHKITLSS
jgi:hypothetical protein